jgi:hypothetical protein
MTNVAPENEESPLMQGLRFLRARALSAHASGDGFAVNHVCRVAFRALARSAHDPAALLQIRLEDVRWVFGLWLYWLLDYELVIEAVGRISVHGLLEKLPRSGQSVHDFTLIGKMFTFLGEPWSSFPGASDFDFPAEWFVDRASQPEDVALLSLAIEFAWFSSPSSGGPWLALVDGWLTMCPRESRLTDSLQTLRLRLKVQTDLCRGSQQDAQIAPDNTGRHEPFGNLEQCWRAFLQCEWTELDDLVKQLSTKTRVDASDYLPLFNLLHTSRPFRPETDDQSVSLSRRFYGMSRQPAQVFHSFRSHRNSENALRLQLQSNPDHGAIDRWKGVVLTMLEQLAALRSWDFRWWLDAVAQEGVYHLELSRFGDVQHAKRGVTCYVLALQNPNKGSNPLYDDAILLLDRLLPEERSEFVRWLSDRRPVEWRAAHRVIVELADSIPDELLAQVANWTLQISLSKKTLLGWSLTYLKFWTSVLPFSDNMREIVGMLIPAVLRDAENPACWLEAPEMLMLCIGSLPLSSARSILERMKGVDVRPVSAQSFERWHIILNGCLHRGDIFDSYRGWLLEQPECNPLSRYMIEHVNRSRNWNLTSQELQVNPDDNPELRDWMRMQIRAFCDEILPEQGGNAFVQMMLPPEHILWVTWPDDESELVDSLVRAVDASDVFVSTKRGPLQVLAFLALRLPETTAHRICDEAVRWLYAGVPGREITSGGPHSVGQFQGITRGSVFPAVLFLIDRAMLRAPVRVNERVASWLLQHGVRQPAEDAHRILLMMARLGLGPDGDHLSFVGLSEAVVNKGLADDPSACIRTYR